MDNSNPTYLIELTKEEKEVVECALEFRVSKALLPWDYVATVDLYYRVKELPVASDMALSRFKEWEWLYGND